MSRPRHEIMRDLKAILAELDYCLEADRAAKVPEGAPVPSDQWKSDISPKLKQALEVTAPPPKSHDEIRAQARAYKPNNYETYEEKPERLKDIRAKARAYKPTDYSDMDNSPKPEKTERLRDYTPSDDPGCLFS